ncbi:MAG: hypothetical protein AAFX52_11170 [Pseudomonadota bacterium]
MENETATDREEVDEAKVLNLLRHERQRSIGLGDGDDLLADTRQRALEYYRGEMRDMKPQLTNRSAVTDSTLADVIETVLPDLLEIIVGEDVLSFQAVNDDDEQQALIEADAIRHVVFELNNGWRELFSVFKDALLLRFAPMKVWVDEERKPLEEGALPDPDSVIETDDEGASFVVKRKICIAAIPAEDFGFSLDGSSVSELTYFVIRSEHRAQDLIADGYDPEEVSKLTREDGETEDDVREARDTSGESEDDVDQSIDPMLRTVTVHEHFLRYDLDGTGIKLWRFMTSTDEAILLGEPEPADGYAFAGFTPFIMPHRLMGLSLADKAIEPQRIATNLLRMTLDSGYFALNQRAEVAEDGASDYTIADLLDNVPGKPVRVQRTGTITPITFGGLNFDSTAVLEYVHSMAERRTGVIRNAQGLDPDSLHDTASGAAQQLTMSQKRVRMMARNFAETGLREMFMGVHRLMREFIREPIRLKRGDKTVEVNPAMFLPRDSIKADIATYGPETAIQAMEAVKNLFAEIIELQGGQLEGPLLSADGVYRTLTKYLRLLPVNGLEGIIRDPSTFEPPEPEESPEMVKAREEIALKREAAEVDKVLAAQKQEHEQTLARQRAEFEAQMARDRQLFEQELAVMRAESEDATARFRPGGALDK